MGSASSRLASASVAHGRILLGTVGVGLLGLLLYQMRQQPAVGDQNQQGVEVELQIDHSCTITDVYDLKTKKLGEGSYGSVYKAKKKDTGECVAVKQIRKNSLVSMRPLANEIDIMKSLDHPNIIKLKETYQDACSVFLVMELALGGELFDRIIESAHFSEKQTAHVMVQIFKAISYCHGVKICVRGTKPEDIMCMTKEAIDQVVLKLIDFGLSKRFVPGVLLTTKCGTPYYVAPQVLAGKYEASCDLWSCGVLMYVTLCGYPPFFGNTDAEVLAKVRLGNYSFNAADWKGISDECKNLIRLLLKMNPRDRITADEALAHEWLAKIAQS